MQSKTEKTGSTKKVEGSDKKIQKTEQSNASKANTKDLVLS